MNPELDSIPTACTASSRFPSRRTGPPTWAVVVAGLLCAAGAGAHFQGMCIQDDRIAAELAPFSGNFCTANDLTFVLIGLGVQEDGCVTSTDESNILNLRAIVENTGAGTRYDAGLWISMQGDVSRCTLSGEPCTSDADCSGGGNICASTARWGACAREFLREPVALQGAESCDPATGGVDLTCGEQGPYLNDDGDGCGDVRKFGQGGPPDCGQTVDLRLDPTDAACMTPDSFQDQVVFDFQGALTFPCVDRDQNGYMEIPTCTSWGQRDDDILCPSRTCSASGTQCTVDGDCPVGEICNAPDCSVCSGSGASCTSDAGCPSGQMCSGFCSVTGAFCNDDIDCSPGQTCDARTCKGSGDPCAVAADCPTGQVCSVSSDPLCRIELALPGTSAKCNCEDGLNSNVPVAELALSCSCAAPTRVRPGDPVTCALSYDNPQPANCIPDPSLPERFRCGATGYLRFNLDDGLGGAESGTFTGVCSGPATFCSLTTSTSCVVDADCPPSEACMPLRCAGDGDCPAAETCSLTTTQGSFAGTPARLLWTPAGSTDGTLGVVGAGDTESLDFVYNLSSDVPYGPITVTASTLWANRTCSGSGVPCEADAQCPAGQTCELDFAAGELQPLVATCDIISSPTPAVVSSFTVDRSGAGPVVRWETSAEIGTLGFDLYRFDERSRQWTRRNESLLPAAGVVAGGTYRFVDEAAVPGELVTYKLEELELDGGRTEHGPYPVRAGWASGSDAEGSMLDAFQAAGRPQTANEVRRFAAGRGAKESAGRLGPGRSTRIKIEVREGGPVWIDAVEIAAASGERWEQVRSRIAGGRLSLSHAGAEVAWEALPEGSGVLFWAERLESPFSLDNVYWIDWISGAQMEVEGGPGPNPAPGPLGFTDSLHVEVDLLPTPVLATDPEQDYWFWKGVISGSGDPALARPTFDLSVDGVAPVADPAEIDLQLWGVTSGGSGHRAEILLDGVSLGEVDWTGLGPHVATLTFPQSLIAEGPNSLQVVGLSGAFFVDSLDLRYHRLYRASADGLLLLGELHPVVSVTGFDRSDISVFDLTDPRRPVRITAATVDQGPAGYRVSFRPSSPDTPYWVGTTDAFRPPRSVRGDVPSALRDEVVGADYVVIAPAMMREGAEALAELRSASGLTAMVVDVEDIMDEFNHGVIHPEAIRSFLRHAWTTWLERPRFAALVGKGSYDYRDLLGYGGQLLPPLMAPTADGLAVADTLLGEVAGSDRDLEIAVGRLPVLTPQELADYVAKIADYEQSEGAWKERVMMIADDPDRAGDFPAASDYLAIALPTDLEVEAVHLGQPYSVAEARQLIREGFDQGAALVNFVGHGGLDRMASEGLLTNLDVPALHNGERLPVVTALSCVLGLYALPGYSSLGEELVVAHQGGAAAVLAPTLLSTNAEAVRLGEHLLNEIFTPHRYRLGDAVLEALNRYAASGGRVEMLRIYELLGDPALSIH